jgi:DNA-binding CsgD family transcriptional regulator
MTSPILLQYFPGATSDQEQQLHLLFERLEVVPYTFYVVMVEEKGKYKIGYISPSVEPLTGHALENFSYDGGAQFLYSITPPEYRLQVLEQESYYLKKARHADFNPSKPFIMEINAALQLQNSSIVTARMAAVILEFTTQQRPKFTINAFQLLDNVPELQLLTLRIEIESILRDIHKASLKIFPVRFPQNSVDSPMKLSSPLYDSEDITPQEYRVLKLLADGFSSHMIADKLYISFHTVETHRRHLLTKFKAVNSAVLIKKATKLYWLE